jgi:ferredoxin
MLEIFKLNCNLNIIKNEKRKMTDVDMQVYKKLAKHLDKMPVGYPPTESGVEVKLLQHLFTPIEAKIASVLNFAPDPLNKIYRRVKKLGLSIEELENILDEMYQKGLINYGMRVEESNEIKYYASAPLAIGIFEYQVDNLSKEFIEYFEQYVEEAFWDEFNLSGVPQLRTIPIEKSITHEQNIATYDELRDVIENSDGIISVAHCVCRQAKDLKNDPCKKTDMRELCFQFRSAAQSYHEKGISRMITKEEAYEILEKAEEAGLVIQPGNSQRPHCICCCCGCCCEVLSNQKRLAKPAQFFATNFYAEVDVDICTGCGLCEERCNMTAITIEDHSIINIDRCIGCGACVPSCPEKAISLKRKEQEIIPPKNTVATYMQIMAKKAEIARAKKQG